MCVVRTRPGPWQGTRALACVGPTRWVCVRVRHRGAGRRHAAVQFCERVAPCRVAGVPVPAAQLRAPRGRCASLCLVPCASSRGPLPRRRPSTSPGAAGCFCPLNHDPTDRSARPVRSVRSVFAQREARGPTLGCSSLSPVLPEQRAARWTARRRASSLSSFLAPGDMWRAQSGGRHQLARGFSLLRAVSLVCCARFAARRRLHTPARGAPFPVTHPIPHARRACQRRPPARPRPNHRRPFLLWAGVGPLARPLVPRVLFASLVLVSLPPSPARPPRRVCSCLSGPVPSGLVAPSLPPHPPRPPPPLKLVRLHSDRHTVTAPSGRGADEVGPPQEEAPSWPSCACSVRSGRERRSFSRVCARLA